VTVKQAIKKFHEFNDGWTPNAAVTVQQENTLKPINLALGAAVAGVPSVHEKAVKAAAVFHLQSEKHTEEDKTQSLLAWLTEMVSAVRSDAGINIDGHLRSQLGLKRSNGKTFYYAIQLKVGGATSDLATLGQTIKQAKVQVGLGG